MTRITRLLGLSSLLLVVLAVPAQASGAPVSLGSFGSTGSGAGQLLAPTDLALNPLNGTVSVADFGNSRISQFSPDGTFVRAFGWDVVPGNPETGLEACTAQTTCRAGTAGGGAGELGAPAAISEDHVGNVYVAQVDDNRVSEFSPTGAFLRAFGYGVNPELPGSGLETCSAVCQTGSAGDGEGQLNAPDGIDVDPQGDIFVANRAGGTIGKFSQTDGYQYTLGNPALAGSGDAATLDNPRGLDYAAGKVYVADSGDARIAAFDAVDSTFTAYGWDVNPVAPSTVLESCSDATGCKHGIAGTGPGQLNDPGSVAATADGQLAVGDLSDPRITRLTAVPTALDAFGDASQLSPPAAVELDCRGALWVADMGNDRIQRFAEPGTPLPPCTTTTPPGPDPTPTEPKFTYRPIKLVRNAKNGTARVTLTLSLRARVTLRDRTLVPVERTAGPGKVSLPVRARGAAKRTLDRTGRAQVTIALYLHPVGLTESDALGRSYTLKKGARPHGRTGTPH